MIVVLGRDFEGSEPTELAQCEGFAVINKHDRVTISSFHDVGNPNEDAKILLEGVKIPKNGILDRVPASHPLLGPVMSLPERDLQIIIASLVKMMGGSVTIYEADLQSVGVGSTLQAWQNPDQRSLSIILQEPK